MIEVKLKASLSGPGVYYGAGSLFTCTKEEAARLIAKGLADPLPEHETARTATDPAVKTARKRGRPKKTK